MTVEGIIRIEIHGQNDERLTVHGQGEGDRGVFLSEDGVDTLLTTAPEKQTWKTGARQKGSLPKNRKVLHKDMDLEFLIKETRAHPYEANHSYLLQAVGWELDRYDDDARYAKVAATTELSGIRYLDIVQYEDPAFVPKLDPVRQQFASTTLKCRAGDPDWYEDDYVSSCTFTADGEGFVEVHNPTPREMRHTWVATMGTWTIPDVSWKGSPGRRYPGGKDSGRLITTPAVTSAHGGLRVNVRQFGKLMAEDFNDTNILALFAGQFFNYIIPPYTQKQRLPVFFEDSEGMGGGRIELHQPRRWPAYCGGEFIA